MASAPRSDDPSTIAALREVLDRTEFTGDVIRAALGTEDDIMSRARAIPVHLRRLAAKGPFGALVQLFILNVPASRALVERAVAPLAIERLAEIGLVAIDGDRVAPLVRLVPHDDLIIASDLRLQAGEHAPNDHVPGVHRPSVTLSHLTVRRRVARGLDLGTGCGVEAILMSRHVERVVGSDVNARAIEFARFNGLLNGASNIAWRVGSWFEPMRDERFDVIACNPPYVISPATQYIYRDSGMEGDSVSEQVVREVGAHLAEGGFGTVTVSWASEPSDSDATAVRRWVQGLGCDAWILHYRTEDPLTTAKSWNEQDAVDLDAYGRVLDDWLAYYERLGIAAIAYGAVVLRKRSQGTTWTRVDAMPAGRLEPASAHILRVFEANTFLQGADDGALLRESFTVPPAVRITQTTRMSDRAVSIELALDEGLGFAASIDANIVNLLDGLAGRTLGEALSRAATEAGIGPADRERFLAAGAGLARRLYAMGFMTRAHAD